MWTFQQSTGKLLDASGMIIAVGYSGHGAGKDNPSDQEIAFVGPCPVGIYDVGAPVDSARVGQYALQLTARPETETFGRSAFFMHGDSISHPGDASEGCIIQPRFARERVWESGDHALQVVE